MANLSSIYNSGSLYEQLISQVIAVESQPKLKLKTEQTDQDVYKAVLGDFSSKVSTLNKLLEKLQDPLQSPFEARAATVGSGAGFSATASDDAAFGQHEIQVDRLARADARVSKQMTAADTTLADSFSGGTRTFTIHIAQAEGDPVDLEISYTPDEGATNDETLAGIASAINDAVETAKVDGLLADGTGASASVVRETSGTARLTLRSLATGYGNRLTFTDPDGLLADLEVDNTAVRSGTGGGAVHAVGTGAEDSDLSASLTLDGLTLYRDSNTVDDALDGVTLTLSATTDEAAPLSIKANVKGMRTEVESFIKAYNGLVSFLATKSKVDPDSQTRGVFAGDAGIRGLRYGMRTDLAQTVSGAGAFAGLADLGITTERDGTLKLSDAAVLEEALASAPGDVGAFFSGTDGLGARLAARIEGLTGAKGVIEQRKATADARIKQLGTQIARWDNRLALREDLLRAQFARLEEITARAQSQQSSLMFYY